MPAILSKNCILIGELDLYCLACSVHLNSEDNALEHIQDLKHKEVINSIEYLATHEQDLIRKVAGIYFCEVCNVTLSTLAKLKVHVTTNAHLAGKKGGALNREGNDVVFAGDVFISESAWHALVEGTCVLCNVEGVDVTAHKSEKSHVINLINNKVIFTANNDLYRKVEDMYQCLTCNQVISRQLLTEHLNSEEHKQRFIFMKDIANNKEQNHKREEGKAKSPQTTPKKVAKPEQIKKREEGNAQSPKTTPKKVAKPENGDKRSPKVQGIFNTGEEMSPISLLKFIESFDNNHGLTILDGFNVFCNLCCTYVPAKMNIIKEHVVSREHTNNEPGSSDPNKKNPDAIVKVKLDQLYQKIQVFHADDVIYFVFYDSLCVNSDIFMGINRRVNKARCRFCNRTLNYEAIPSHNRTRKHNDFIINSYLYVSLKGEFVREIKPNLFDCAYCGELKTSYSAMKSHLATDEHKKRREEHENILKKFNPRLAQGGTSYLREFAHMLQNLFTFFD